jgi:DNA repair protein RecN (Recombination protein N)
MSDHPFSVSKAERDGRTFTEVEDLDREGRKQELARLTGGVYVSKAILEGAEELLREAEAFKKQD